MMLYRFFFFKHKTAYEMRISDWSSDVCSSDLYKHSLGQPYIYPKNELSYTGNFLHMMFATPCEDYKVNEVVERALDRIFILHADHEQNASTDRKSVV